MDDPAALRALGFHGPSPAYLFGLILFGLLGWAAFRHGRRSDRPRTKWLGVAMMLYPYLVGSTALLYLVGAALCALIWLDRG